MGITDKINEKILRVFQWGNDKGITDIENKIHAVLKNGRLVLVNGNQAVYTNKKGQQKSYTFEKLASELIVIGGWADQMSTLGITHADIVNILNKEYEKQKEAS